MYVSIHIGAVKKFLRNIKTKNTASNTIIKKYTAIQDFKRFLSQNGRANNSRKSTKRSNVSDFPRGETYY